ncbi:hypothetical protein AQPE_1657 [Aquipluma nitroreducens]|uniref:Uncharacterized protein n=1 Tax=Aquipluma nitroreducens TaxID=2010828 RepID=A0A5K7S7J4_9BACT|nr:hypothetical protein AQPE_1657 [Aquipluma nitroreducens]
MASYYLSVGLLQMQLPFLKHRGDQIFPLSFQKVFKCS